jgi:hypothetical protein
VEQEGETREWQTNECGGIRRRRQDDDAGRIYSPDITRLPSNTGVLYKTKEGSREWKGRVTEVIVKTEAVRILTGVTTINRRVMSEGDVMNNVCEPTTKVLSSVFHWKHGR